MNRIAEFEKVSFEKFRQGWISSYGEMSDELIQTAYDEITLPTRATSGSAGYDFCLPRNLRLEPGRTEMIPTGIRVRMEEGWALMLFPRSGLGFKFRMQLNNTVGVIDSDYYGSENEGHIFAKITNDSREGKTLILKRGEAFLQGVFLPYGITETDDASTVRNGGFGSTSSENK